MSFGVVSWTWKLENGRRVEQGYIDLTAGNGSTENVENVGPRFSIVRTIHMYICMVFL